MTRKSTLGLLLSLLLSSAACGDENENARELWETKEPAGYVYDIESRGNIGMVRGTVTVEAGVVTSSSYEGSGPGPRRDQTIEGLFDDIAQRKASDCSVDVEYEASRGYPLDVYSDCGEEGDGWRITRFEPLP